MNLIKLFIMFSIVVFYGFISSVFPQNFPVATGYVNDYANVFTPSEKNNLENILKQYEKKTSIEIAVVTVKDIQKTYIEKYANNLFNAWGIGKKQNNAGLLIFLSLDKFDRGLRIEVGYGLEQFITDYKASEVINMVMPSLKKGNYATALITAANECISIIGNQSEEARQQYLKELEIQKANEKIILTYIIFIIIGVAILIFLSFYFRNLYLKFQKERQAKKQYLQRTWENLSGLEIIYDDTISAVDFLAKQQFYNANNVLQALQEKESVIKIQLKDRLNKAKKHTAVVQIANEIEKIGDELKNTATEIFENHNIEVSIRNQLQTQIEDIKRKIDGSIPQAKKLIDTINSNNPESIWRGFDYKNFDKIVETSFNNSQQMANMALKQLDNHMYSDAKKSANSAMIYINDAFKYVKSIFDVNAQINNGKEKYNQYINKLPNMIETTNTALNRPNVKQSTKKLFEDVQLKYAELQNEIQKQNKLDWILIGAIILMIVTKCDFIVRQSSADIRQYEEEEEQKRQRKREEEYRRLHSSSIYNGSGTSYGDGGGSSFGGFGGGFSGGGGSTGRF